MWRTYNPEKLTREQFIGLDETIRHTLVCMMYAWGWGGGGGGKTT